MSRYPIAAAVVVAAPAAAAAGAAAYGPLLVTLTAKICIEANYLSVSFQHCFMLCAFT